MIEHIDVTKEMKAFKKRNWHKPKFKKKPDNFYKLKLIIGMLILTLFVFPTSFNIISNNIDISKQKFSDANSIYDKAVLDSSEIKKEADKNSKQNFDTIIAQAHSDSYDYINKYHKPNYLNIINELQKESE